jgi:peptide deformylase
VLAHLDGTLYVERMESRSFSTLENHRRHWAGRTTPQVREALRLPPREG